jgi:hypothetical protein
MKNTQECVCEHCNKKFSSHYTLQTHIKTAKYCLKIRGEKLDTNHICKHCNVQFTQKTALVKHLKSCKIAKKSMRDDNVESNDRSKFNKSYDDKIMILEKALRDEKHNHEVYYEDSLETIKKLKGRLKQEKDKNKKLKQSEKQSDLSNQQLLKEKDAKISEQEVGIAALLRNEISMRGMLIRMNNSNLQNPLQNPKTINNDIKQKALIPIKNIPPFTIDITIDLITEYDYETFMKGVNDIINFIKGLSVLDNETEKNLRNNSRIFHRLIKDIE